jgi:SAM-dependent methyltransferase
MISEATWMARHLRANLARAARGSARSAREWRRFWSAYAQYRRLAPPDRKPSVANLYPCLGDATSETEIEPVYFYQDAWAFERIVERRPAWHVDVGSHHKFVALLSKVVAVTMVDLRPLALPLPSLRFVQGSILDLPFDTGSVPSVSSLCVIEHIGLGRYGDPLDPFGTERALDELKRIVAPGGDFYLSAPIEPDARTYFNAHRTYAPDALEAMLEPCEVLERRYIHGETFTDEYQARAGVACYHLKKPL